MKYDYSTGKIYLIKCNKTGLGYVGSTKVPLKDRLKRHETDYRGYMGLLNKPRNLRGSAECIINEDYDIHLIENYPCDGKRELEHREAMWQLFLTKKINLTNRNHPHQLTYKDIEDIENFIIPDFV